jgi:regulator of protease activity HflC (stomatin/prohibitin superfamily)
MRVLTLPGRLIHGHRMRHLSWFSKSASPILFVPQQEVYLIERFGRYDRQVPGGPLFKWPFLERVAGVQVLKEIVLEIDQQKAITKDNVAVGLDGVLYIKIEDPYKAQYGVVNAEAAVTAIAQTAMRSEIGKLSLDGIFSERDGLNTAIVSAINSATNQWGLVCLRYEIRDLEIPNDIKIAMQKQVEAEREKRASILRSEGVRESAVNEAEGTRKAQILHSEAQKIKLINEAEGQAQAIIANAEAKASAIEKISEKLGKSDGNNAANFELASKYIDSFSNLAKETNTLILPADAGDVPKMITTAMKTLDTINKEK